MFVHWYFMRFRGSSPFGPTGSDIDLRSYWMGFRGCEWSESRKGGMKREVGLVGMPHTHHAGEDAAELAAVFEGVLKMRRPTGQMP